MKIETAVLAIYALRGYPEKTATDFNVSREVASFLEDGECDDYAFTSESSDDFAASGWAIREENGGAVKMTKGKSDIYIVALNDDRLGMFGQKNLTFLDR